MATFAGGCFWCTEAIFKRVKGVTSVTSGYAGGEVKNPSYEQVSTGRTGHTEAVQIEYNPEIISYDNLLKIFWAVHDPTTLDRQGSDIGSQYRSVIFYHNDIQRKQAERSKKEFERIYNLRDRIVTEINPYKTFYTAEEYHRDYYDNKNNMNAYCSLVISPKIEKLLYTFNNLVKDEYKR